MRRLTTESIIRDFTSVPLDSEEKYKPLKFGSESVYDLYKIAIWKNSAEMKNYISYLSSTYNDFLNISINFDMFIVTHISSKGDAQLAIELEKPLIYFKEKEMNQLSRIISCNIKENMNEFMKEYENLNNDLLELSRSHSLMENLSKNTAKFGHVRLALIRKRKHTIGKIEFEGEIELMRPEVNLNSQLDVDLIEVLGKLFPRYSSVMLREFHSGFQGILSKDSDIFCQSWVLYFIIMLSLNPHARVQHIILHMFREINQGVNFDDNLAKFIKYVGRDIINGIERENYKGWNKKYLPYRYFFNMIEEHQCQL